MTTTSKYHESGRRGCTNIGDASLSMPVLYVQLSELLEVVGEDRLEISINARTVCRALLPCGKVSPCIL